MRYVCYLIATVIWAFLLASTAARAQTLAENGITFDPPLPWVEGITGTVTFTLREPAPPSGTRIILQSDKFITTVNTDDTSGPTAIAEIGPGQFSGSIKITARDDNVAEKSDSVAFFAFKDNAVNTRPLGGSTFTIDIVDRPKAVSIVTDDATIAAGGDSAKVRVKLDSTVPASQPGAALDVALNFADGTAIPGTDFEVDGLTSDGKLTIRAGFDSGRFGIRARQDATVGRTIVASVAGRPDIAPVEITIGNNEPPTIKHVTVTGNSISEADVGNQSSIEIELSRVAPAGFSVPIVIGGTAVQNSDFTFAFIDAIVKTLPDGSQELTVTDGSSSILTIFIDISPINDDIFEPDEEVTVKIGSQPPVTVKIVDDDPRPPPALAAENGITFDPPLPWVEGVTGKVTFTLKDPAGPDGVVVTLVDGNTDDTIVRTPSVTIPEGKRSGSIEIDVTEDDNPDNDKQEGEETHEFSAFFYSNSEATRDFSIRIVDQPKVVSITADPETITEGGAPATVTVTLDSAVPASTPNGGGITVEIFVDNAGTGSDGNDYSVSGLRLTRTGRRDLLFIPVGSDSGTFTIAANPDELVETGEKVRLRTSKIFSREQEVEITIKDAVTGPPPTVERVFASPLPTIYEPEDTTAEARRLSASVVTFELSGKAPPNFSVPITISGTATPGLDFLIEFLNSDLVYETLAVGAPLPVDKDDNGGSFYISPLHDNVADAGETVTVKIGNQDPITVTIGEGGPPPGPLPPTIAENGITFEPPLPWAEGITGKVTFTLTDPAPPSGLDILLSPQNTGQFTAETSDTGGAGIVQIAGGKSSGSLELEVKADDDKGPETLIFHVFERLTGRFDTVLHDADVAIDIVDQPKVVSITTDRATIAKGGDAATVTVKLDANAPPGEAVEVKFDFGGNAIFETDFEVSGLESESNASSGTIRIQGSQSGTFTIAARPDATVGRKIIASVVGRDDIAPVEIAIADGKTVEPPALAENGITFDPPLPWVEGITGKVTFTLKEPAGPGGTIVFLHLPSSRGTNQRPITANTDDTQGIGQVVIDEGSSGSIEILARADDVAEGKETVTFDVRLVTSEFSPVTLPDKVGIDIVDQPTAKSILPDQLTVSEGGAPITVTVKLDATVPKSTPGGAIDVPLDFAGSTATRGEDFEVTGLTSEGKLTIGAESDTGTFTIAATPDTLDEGDETIKVAVKGRAEIAAATITINNVDAEQPAVAQVTASPETISEDNGRTTVTVSLNRAPTAADGLTVPVTFSGSAGLTTDYNARSDAFEIANGSDVQLKFPQGRDKQTITLTAIADREKEEDESIIVSVGGRSATIALTNVFKESILADVRRTGSFAMLRRSTDRFSRLTGDIVHSRLNGRRFSRHDNEQGGRTTLREFANGLGGPNKHGLKDGGGKRSGTGNWDAWVSVSAAELSGKAAGRAYDVYVGADAVLAPGVLFGVLASYETGDLETSGRGDLAGEGAYTGRFKSEARSIGGYAGIRLFDDLTLDLAGSYGYLSPELSAVFRESRHKNRSITGAYDARRTLLSGHLTGQAVFGNLHVTPQVGLVYARENQDGFTDSTNAVANAATLEFARFEFGTTLAYDFGLKPDMGALGVWLKATGRSDFIRPDDVADQYSLALSLGLQWVDTTTGLSLELEGSADGIGLDGYNSYDATASVKVPF